MYCVVTNACNACRNFECFEHHLNIVKTCQFLFSGHIIAKGMTQRVETLIATNWVFLCHPIMHAGYLFRQ